MIPVAAHINSKQQCLCKYSQWICTLYLQSHLQICVSPRNLRWVCEWNPMATLQKGSKPLSPNFHIYCTSVVEWSSLSTFRKHSPVRTWLILYLLLKSSTFLFLLFHRVSPTSILFFCASLSNSGTLYCGISYVTVSVACLAFVVVFLVSKSFWIKVSAKWKKKT